MRGNEATLDPRTKLVVAVAAILIVSSTPPGVLAPFPWYFLVIGAAWALSRVQPSVVLGRLAAGSLFLLMAAGLLLLSDAGWQSALSVLLKGYAALIVLTLLTATTDITSLLWAMGKLGAPRVLTLLSAMMLRFVWMLFEEFGRMSRARASRCGRPLAGELLFRAHGSQAALLLVRSWERADRIYNGMLARGFTGEMPQTRSYSFSRFDGVAMTAILGTFAAFRYFFSRGIMVILSASIVTSRLIG